MSKKIIYIMSDVRSGSTLLENILSKSNEILSVGELNHLDSHIHKGPIGKTWKWKCSCGSSFYNCEFWTKIFDSLKEKGIDSIDKTSVSISDDILNISSDNNRIITLLNSIYKAIFENSNQKVIVDSSKFPLQGLLVYKKADFDVKVIYLKRDIRSVVISKQKWKKKFNGTNPNIYKILYRTKLYEKRCLKYLKQIDDSDKITIDYKSLSSNPQEIIDLITNKFGLYNFTVSDYMYIENDHTIGGTPNRFVKRKIEYDSTWKLVASKKPIFNILGKILKAL